MQSVYHLECCLSRVLFISANLRTEFLHVLDRRHTGRYPSASPPCWGVRYYSSAWMVCLPETNGLVMRDGDIGDGGRHAFGAKLRQARIAKDWTQEQLASRVECSASYLSKLESSVIGEPSGSLLIRLAHAFEWSVDGLYEFMRSIEDRHLDVRIEALESTLRRVPDLGRGELPLNSGCRNKLLDDVPGKRLYVDVLEALALRVGVNADALRAPGPIATSDSLVRQ